MAKLTLSDLAGGYLAITTINANHTLIENAFENTLSRDGTSPNTMLADFDMNSNQIINLGQPAQANDAVRLVDLQSASIVTQLPTQTGNANKYLKTDGSAASWQTAPVVNAADYATLQLALTAAAGKVLYGGKATFTYTTAIDVPSNTLVRDVVFNSNVASALSMSVTSATNITFENCTFKSAGTYSAVMDFTTCDHIKFINCTFDLPITAGSVQSSVGVRSFGSTNLLFDNCRFYDADSFIYLDKSGATLSDHVTVKNCYFEHRFVGAGNNPTCVYQYFAKNTLTDGCTFKNIVAGGASPIAGYAVYEGDGEAVSMTVVNCTSITTLSKPHVLVQNSTAPNCIVGNNKMVAMPGTDQYRNELINSRAVLGSVHVHDNYVEHADIFVAGGGTLATATRQANIHNNHIIGMNQTTPAIWLGLNGTYFVDYASVKDNVVYACRAGAIQCAEVRYAVIEGNHLMNWNTSNRMPTNTYAYTAAVYVDGTTLNGVIRNNRIENSTYVPADSGYCQYGIVCSNATNGLIVEQNDITDTLIAAYLNVNNTTEVNGLNISGNVTHGRGTQRNVQRTSVSTSATTIYSQTGAGVGEATLCLVVGGISPGPTPTFCDLVLITASITPVVVSSVNSAGPPSTRTYTMSGNSLQLALSASTYLVSVTGFGISA